MRFSLGHVGLLGGVCVALFVLLRFVLGSPPLWAMGLGLLGVFLLGFYLWEDRSDRSADGAHRALQARASGLFLVAVSVSVAVLFNAAAGRFEWRLDASTANKHTLSSYSLSAAEGLEFPVEVVGLFPEGSLEERSFVDLFNRFDRVAEGLSLQLIDPLVSPMEFDALREFMALETLGTLQVLFLKRDSEGLPAQSVVLDGPVLEEDFVRALTKVQVDKKALVCFTQGHGERDLGERHNLVDYGGIHERLLGANYEVGLVGPLQSVPPRCSVLVVAAPETALHSVTQENLASYVKAGGAMVVLLEPVLPGQVPSLPMDLSRYGLAVGEDLVIENHPDRVLANADQSHIVVDMDSFDFHPIVNGLERATVFQGARTVDVGTPIEGLHAQALAFTTEEGWAETDPASMTGQAEAKRDPHEKNNVPLMAVVEVVDPKAIQVGPTRLEGEEGPFSVRLLDEGELPPRVLPRPEGRAAIGKLVVFGDADFIGNRLVLGGVNHDLFLNTLAWMIDQEAPRGERSHDARKGLMVLTDAQSTFMWRLVIGGMPGLCLFFAGVAVWRRRDAA